MDDKILNQVASVQQTISSHRDNDQENLNMKKDAINPADELEQFQNNSDVQVKANLLQSYNRNAQERDGSAMQEWKIAERTHFLHCLHSQGKKTLLEIGSGPGRDGSYFQENGLQVVCIDLSPEMVKLCQAKNLTAYTMDFYSLNFPQESFDAVWALNCLLHVSKASICGVLENIKAVLKPGGLFFLGLYGGYDSEGVWEEDFYVPKRFFAFYTDDHLKAIVQRYFTLTYYKNIPLNDSLHFQSLILKKEEQ